MPTKGYKHCLKGDPVVNESKCTLCEKCSDLCSSNAREIVGKIITVKSLMSEIIKDEVFYEESNGGVTFSGGNHCYMQII